MKIFFYAAALIFSAAASTVLSQETSPSPEFQTTISNGSPIQLPIANRPVTDLLAIQQQPSYIRPNAKTRFKRYVDETVGPIALVRQVASAGIGTWTNSPEEWGGQWEGFGRRLASGFGKNLIRQTTTYGLDEALKLDSYYYRSQKKDAGSKIKNALLSPVTARNAKGKRVIGVPRLVGTYAANIVEAEAWYPSRYDWKDGAKSGTISLGINAAYNLFREFVWKK